MIEKTGIFFMEDNEEATTVIAKGFTILIIKTDEGIVVDVYSAKDMAENQHPEIIASTYAFDTDLLGDENEL